jgi:hypothetical protein
MMTLIAGSPSSPRPLRVVVNAFSASSNAYLRDVSCGSGGIKSRRHTDA